MVNLSVSFLTTDLALPQGMAHNPFKIKIISVWAASYFSWTQKDNILQYIKVSTKDLFIKLG